MTNVLDIQPKVATLLKKAFARNKLTHAYLFYGNAGVGKKDMAIWTAKRFFCLEPCENEPCMECSECKRIDSLNHPDLHIIEPNGQSIKIDQIRSLQKEFHFKGVEGDKKCYIIEHVDKMTVQAANSLLKFLEEPNGQSLAILLTENKHRLLDTIVSRVQSYQFQSLSKKVVYDSLTKEGIDSETAYLLTQLNRGGKELLEEDWFYQAKELIFDTLNYFLEDPYGAVVHMQTEWAQVFSDKVKQQISIELLTIYLREVMWYFLQRPIGLKERIELLKALLEVYNIGDITELMGELITAKGKLRSNAHYGMVLDQVGKSMIQDKEKLQVV
jgi:DNA polymerase III subunit delta'